MSQSGWSEPSSRLPMRRRPGLVALVALFAVAALAISLFTLLSFVRVAPSATLSEDSAGDDGREPATGVDVYRGVGTWIDVYDYIAARQPPGSDPPILPEDLELARSVGVGTVYLQAADQSTDGLADQELAGEFLTEAHAARLNVVAWYLPTLIDVPADLARLEAIRQFEVDGHRFDGIAVDIEPTDGGPDGPERTRRLVELSARLKADLGDEPVGAIVPTPVLLEDVNRELWPDFPWAELADAYDVWLPMIYWTGRRESSGYRDASTYTRENVRRLRQRVDDEAALVHVIGGVGPEIVEDDYPRFVAALLEVEPIGASIYDFRTTSVEGLVSLARLSRANAWSTAGLQEGSTSREER